MVMPATMVGSANGMSISTSRNRTPRKRSRTSIQAIAVPITALTAVTPSELSSVNRMAASDSGRLSADQKPDHPAPVAFATIAASGNSTSTLSHVTARPSPTDAAPDSGAPASARDPRRRDRTGDAAMSWEVIPSCLRSS
jgi:hypothetical protein